MTQTVAPADRRARRSARISFTTANYVAREVGYDLDHWVIDDPVDPYLGGWRRCSAAVTERFRSIEGFAENFDAILGEIAGAGFEAVEIWGTHLDPYWATPEHVEVARASLERHGLTTVAYGADMGASREDAEKACGIAVALGSPLFGTYPGPLLVADRATALDVVRDHGLRMMFENHPEHPTPEVLLAEIGEDPIVGALVDTGWWGTHGYDAAEAITRLGDRILHVHLKDVVRPGTHDPCLLGEGCVPIDACLDALARIGYDGAITIEHLTANVDPIEDCRVMRESLLANPRFPEA